MKTFLYGIMALSLGCPKKAETPATPEQAQATFVKDYLLRDVPGSVSGYHCNLIHIGTTGMQVGVCYAEPNAEPLFGGPRLKKEAIVVAFNMEPIVYLDKNIDGTLDSIVEVSTENWQETSLDTLPQEEKERLQTNYNVALTVMQDVAAKEASQAQQTRRR